MTQTPNSPQELFEIQEPIHETPEGIEPLLAMLDEVPLEQLSLITFGLCNKLAAAHTEIINDLMEKGFHEAALTNWAQDHARWCSAIDILEGVTEITRHFGDEM